MSRSERAKLRNLKRGGASSSDEDQPMQDQDDIEDDDQEMRDDQIAEDMDEESGSEIPNRKGNESSDSVQEIRKPVGRSTRRGQRGVY